MTVVSDLGPVLARRLVGASLLTVTLQRHLPARSHNIVASFSAR
jgi:hypothetical protein